MATGLVHAADALDLAVSRLLLPFSSERGVLLPLVFHSLYGEPGELSTGAIDPSFATPIDVFEEVVVGLKDAGYRFVSPVDLVGEIDPRGRYTLLTLDDGYANQLRAVAVMERHEIPATFFVATGSVASGESFWWDVLYRNLVRKGVTSQEYRAALMSYQSMTPATIKETLIGAYGEDSFEPEGGFDRPMTEAEVRNLARSPLVTFGNHTRDHAILTTLSDEEGLDQIKQAQDKIETWTGRAPVALAYPDGVYDPRFAEWGATVGLKLAFTVVAERRRLPISAPDYRIGRFSINPKRNVASQLRALRAPWSMGKLYRRLGRRLKENRSAR